MSIAFQLNDSFPDSFEESADSDEAKQTVKDFLKHKDLRSSEQPQYAFWNSLVDMLQIVLLFLRGTREGNFELHLAAVRMMLPWFHAYDRQNYQRYLSVYIAEMMQLKTSHPDVYASALCELGTAWDPSQELLCAIEKFVCALYGEKDCSDINEVRYRLFCRDLKSEENHRTKTV